MASYTICCLFLYRQTEKKIKKINNCKIKNIFQLFDRQVKSYKVTPYCNEILKPLDAHCCHTGTASDCPDVKNCKLRLNPVWHRMLYTCTHMTTVDVKRFYWKLQLLHIVSLLL